MKKIILAISSLVAITMFASKPIELNIIHINDHHSHLEPEETKIKIDGISTSVKIGGYPEMVGIIKDLQKEVKNPLTLHAGDAITGTLYFTLFNGSVDADLMNLTGLDYFTLGNHEFDAGNEGLKKFLDILKVPVLSANVIPDKGSILEGYWKPYDIKIIDGEKVGIIGIDVVKKTVNSSSPGDDIKFIDEAKTAQKYSDILKEQGVDKVILLSHGGSAINQRIARDVTGIDVIITGDTHHLYGNDTLREMGMPVIHEYPTIIKNKAGEYVVVVEAWCYSYLVGHLGLKFDEKGLITNVYAAPKIPYHVDSKFTRKDKDGKKYTPKGAELKSILKSLEKNPYFVKANPDKTTYDVLEVYKVKKQKLGGEVVGELVGESMPGGSENRIPSKANPRGSVATRFIAETMLTQMRSFGKNAKLDFVIQNSGGVRDNINPGVMTYNDAYTILPFANTLTLLTLKGSEAVQLIEDALDYASNGSTGAFPYGAAIRYEANQYKDANGKRVIKVEVQDANTGEWNLIDYDKEYVVGTNSYIAKGKDGYITFGKVSSERGMEDTFLPDAESLIKFMKLNPKFSTYKESNVIFHYDEKDPIRKK